MNEPITAEKVSVPAPAERTWKQVKDEWRGMAAFAGERSDGAWFFVMEKRGRWASPEHQQIARAALNTYLDPECTCTIRSTHDCPARDRHRMAFKAVDRVANGRVRHG